ncbi:FAD:protein FMN transferase [Halomonas piscis]|uniref:FAD:protein FMN transferase n=1 Tax=Halomonas piscis TaxID=3031727 RepID=A0ABY9YZQ0_9GAMM|nr:FAD:protein FMN transferase [Halomonas piscis]WNK20242.1 FAD:protein FMN transferase [Halomonas piscis]
MQHNAVKALTMGAMLMALALVAGCESEPESQSPVRFEGSIFGTFYQITVADTLDQNAQEALEDGFLDELERVDEAMSTYRDDSDLVAFNQAPLDEWQSLPPPLIKVMSISQQISRQSDGAFDVTIGGLVNLWSFGPEARPESVPGEGELSARLEQVGFDALEVDTDGSRARRSRDVFVDLSAVAKGYATDRVAAYLDEQGIDNYLVNLGGDLTTSGYRDPDEQMPWRIGIEKPRSSGQSAQYIIPLSGLSAATSGDYRNYFEQDGQRFSHTIDPRTGRPISHSLASVTVVHPSNARADAWATAMTVLGGEEGMALAQALDLKVLMLVRDEDSWQSLASPAFADFIGADFMADHNIKVAGDTSAETQG